jgi:hypothetical protein
VSRIPLDTQPMVWRLTLRTPEGEQPVDVVMALASIDDKKWIGEVRVDGYPGEETTFPIRACDWIQAHQMMLAQVEFFLHSFAEAGPLFWRGTDVPFEIPAWRVRRPSLRDRLRAWWAVRRAPAGA